MAVCATSLSVDLYGGRSFLEFIFSFPLSVSHLPTTFLWLGIRRQKRIQLQTLLFRDFSSEENANCRLILSYVWSIVAAAAGQNSPTWAISFYQDTNITRKQVQFLAGRRETQYFPSVQTIVTVQFSASHLGYILAGTGSFVAFIDMVCLLSGVHFKGGRLAWYCRLQANQCGY